MEYKENWIINGGVEEEWDKYIGQLENIGMNEVVAAWQSAYDRYQEEVNNSREGTDRISIRRDTSFQIFLMF